VNEMTVTVCIIEGSWGRLHVDTETGDVLRLSGAPKDAESEGYHDIARFDLEEWKRFYNQDTCRGADILDVGYWTKEGIYEPAAAKHRDEIARGAFTIICNDKVAKLLKHSTQT
jgi:hypothetical protein